MALFIALNLHLTLIRFGKYEGTWTEKSNTDVKERLFPIPQTAIDAASNLPGYLMQNAGY